MITDSAAFSLKLFPVIVFTAFFFASLFVPLKSNNRKPIYLPVRSLMVGVSALMIMIIGGSFYFWLRGNIAIRAINFSEVKSIAIDHRTFDNPNDVHQIVNALNQAEYYAPNREKTGTSVPLVISYQSGKTAYYRVSKFSNDPGVVIIFAHPIEKEGYWSYGEAYIPTLDKVLLDLEYRLPE